MTTFLFTEVNVEVPDAHPRTWTDAKLIEFIDAYDADMKLVDEDAILPWNRCTDVYFAAWLELHARTETAA